jgi:hypothetical protein
VLLIHAISIHHFGKKKKVLTSTRSCAILKLPLGNATRGTLRLCPSPRQYEARAHEHFKVDRYDHCNLESTEVLNAFGRMVGVVNNPLPYQPVSRLFVPLIMAAL